MPVIEATVRLRRGDLKEFCARAARFPGLREPPKDDIDCYELNRLPENLEGYDCVPTMRVRVELRRFEEKNSVELIRRIMASNVSVLLRRVVVATIGSSEIRVAVHVGQKCALLIPEHVQRKHRDALQRFYREWLNSLGLTESAGLAWTETSGHEIESRSSNLVPYDMRNAESLLRQNKILFGGGDFSVWGIPIDQQFQAWQTLLNEMRNSGEDLGESEAAVIVAGFLPQKFKTFREAFSADEIDAWSWRVALMVMPSSVKLKTICDFVDSGRRVNAKIFTIKKNRSRPQVDGYMDVGEEGDVEISIQSELSEDVDGGELEDKMCALLNELSGQDSGAIVV